MSRLLILGAGQYGFAVKEIAEATGCFTQIDFLDDRSELAVGKLSDIDKIDYDFAIVAIGNSELRERLMADTKKVCTLVHPKAYVSGSAEIGNGCIIEALAGVGTNVIVGSCSIIKMGDLLDHDSIMAKACYCDNYCVVKTGAYVQPCHTISRYSVINSLEEEQKIRDEYN